MDNNNNIENELSDIAPFLAGMKKRNNFSVPENYFEEFPAKVRDRIGYGQKVSLWHNLVQYFSLKTSLAVMSLIVLIGAGIFLSVNYHGKQSLAGTITPKEYILENVDEDMIMDELVNADAKRSKIHSKNTEEYILDNVEESTITEEL